MLSLALKKIFILLFMISIFIFTPVLNAEDLREIKKWDRIENLIFEEIQSIKKNKPMTEEKYYRVLELLSERLSIIKKRENYLLIKLGDQLNPLIKKKRISKLKTLRKRNYLRVKKLGEGALRKKISKKVKGKISFLLGLNSRDFSDGSELVKYLKMALRFKASKKLNYKINVQLAEHYYNEKEFSNALYHYNIVLKHSKSDWYYKHFFNASWCLFRLKKKKIALKNLEKIFMEEKKWNYFQNKKTVMESYFIFSSFYKDIKKPLAFLQKLGGESDSVSNYLDFARMTSKQGLYKKTKTILEFIKSKKNKDLKSNKYLKAEYLYFKVKFFDEFKKEKEYFSILKKIKGNLTNYLKSEQKNSLIVGLEKKIIFFQQCIFKNNKKTRQKLLCFKKFKIAKKTYLVLKRDDFVKMEYFTANIYQALGIQNKAKYYYKLAIKKSINHKKNIIKNREYLKKALLSLIKIQLKYESENEKKKRENKELLWSINIFLNHFPNHKLSLSFHKKMFTLNFELGHDQEVKRNFDDFRKKYPDQKDIAISMIEKILNKLILKKKTKKIYNWVIKIKKEKIDFPKEKFEKILNHLASLLLSKYQIMADQGKLKESEKGLYKMISEGLFSKEILSKVYFSLVFVQNQNQSYIKAYQSFLEGVKRHPFGRKDETLGTMAALLNQFFYSVGKERYFKGAYLISEKICFLDGRYKKNIMEGIFEFSKADGALRVIKKSLDEFQVCSTEDLLEKKISSSFNFYIKRNDFKSLHFLMKEYGQNISLKKYWWIPFVFEVQKKRRGNIFKAQEDILKIFKEKKINYETTVLFKLNSLKKMEEIYFKMKKYKKLLGDDVVISDLKRIRQIEGLNEIFLGKESFHIESMISTPLVLNSFRILFKKIQLKKGKFVPLKNKIKIEISKYKKYLGEEFNYKDPFYLNDYPINEMIVTNDL